MKITNNDVAVASAHQGNIERLKVSPKINYQLSIALKEINSLMKLYTRSRQKIFDKYPVIEKDGTERPIKDGDTVTKEMREEMQELLDIEVDFTSKTVPLSKLEFNGAAFCPECKKVMECKECKKIAQEEKNGVNVGTLVAFWFLIEDDIKEE